MATRLNQTSPNWTDTTGWMLCDGGAENDSEAVSATVPTAGGASSDSSTFTPTGTACEGFLVKIAGRAVSPTGTATFVFRQSGADIAGSTITVNIADLPAIGFAATPSGWYYLKYATPWTYPGGAILLRATTTSASQLILYASSGNNWARELAGDPAGDLGALAANDRIICCGEYTGAGTSNARTVTMDGTASTTWGSAAGANSLNVCSLCTLTLQTTASKTYLLNLLGLFNCYINSTVNFGTSGTRLPSTSTFTFTFQNASNVDCGWEIRAGPMTINVYGNNISYVSTKLAADVAAAGTSLTTVDSTGWKNGNNLAIPTTTRTASECESKTMTADASGTSISISAVTNAHSGTNDSHGDLRAEVVNLTRNIVIQGNSATLGAYINIAATPTVNFSYVEFAKLGSATSLKRGIDIGTGTGTFACTGCSVHDCTVASSRAFNITATTGTANAVNIQSCVTYNVASIHFNVVATSGAVTLNNIIAIRSTDAVGDLFSLGDAGSTYTNLTGAGSGRHGIFLSEAALGTGTYSGWVGHGCGTSGVIVANITSGTISTITSQRNAVGMDFNAGTLPITVDALTTLGNSSQGAKFAAGVMGTVCTNWVMNAGTTLTQPVAIDFNGSVADLLFISCTFGATDTFATGDVRININQIRVQARFHNTLFGSATELANQTNLLAGSFLHSQKHDQTAGLYKTWDAEGTDSVENTVGLYDVAPGLRVTPNISANSAAKKQGGGFEVTCANGAAITASCKVRKSVSGDGTAYGGGQPRLILRKNVPMGIAADTVLATATNGANGAFEPESGTTINVTDDGVLTFIIDCDGTTGWINVDSWAQTGGLADNGNGKCWQDGEPYVSLPAGGAVAGGVLVAPWFGRRYC